MTDIAARAGFMPENLTRSDSAPGPGSGPEKALAELHTRLLDTIQGFEKVREKAEPEFRPIAIEFHALHLRQAESVARMLSAMGHDPETDGSIFGTVNSAVVTVRSWFDDVSTNIMDSLIQGEKHVLDAYGAAISALDDPLRRRQLEADRQDLVALLDRHAG